jgi:hypothetical protein
LGGPIFRIVSPGGIAENLNELIGISDLKSEFEVCGVELLINQNRALKGYSKLHY